MIAVAVLMTVGLPGAARAQQQLPTPNGERAQGVVPLGCYQTVNGNIVFVPCTTSGATPVPGSGGAPLAVTTNQTGGTTSATAGAFTIAAAANPGRHGCTYQNISTGIVYLFFGAGTATVAASFQIAAGDSATCEQAGIVLTDEIQIAASIASAAYIQALQ
jgi:hypothetical protein